MKDSNKNSPRSTSALSLKAPKTANRSEPLFEYIEGDSYIGDWRDLLTEDGEELDLDDPDVGFAIAMSKKD